MLLNARVEELEGLRLGQTALLKDRVDLQHSLAKKEQQVTTLKYSLAASAQDISAGGGAAGVVCPALPAESRAAAAPRVC